MKCRRARHLSLQPPTAERRRHLLATPAHPLPQPRHKFRPPSSENGPRKQVSRRLANLRETFPYGMSPTNAQFGFFRLPESPLLGLGSGPMARYVFITGGVVSSLGKGIASAALGALL